MDIDQARAEVRRLFMAGVAAADPYQAVIKALEEGGASPDLIIAVGKAARRMAEAALTLNTGVKTIVVTNYENAKPLDGAVVLPAGHPVPDAKGEAAAKTVISALEEAAGSGAEILVLVSGGGSALLPAPVEGVTLAEKAEVNRLLLASGADIGNMNLVRQQISRLKGGGMVRLAAPAKVTALILSDVVGDDLSIIASGPTVAPISDAKGASDLLRDLGLWEKVPASVRNHLQNAPNQGPVPTAENHLIGSNRKSVQAMVTAANADVRRIEAAVEGDVAEAARYVCDQAGPGGLTVWGGETTVTLTGNGQGGRNQEMALRIALEARERGWGMDWVCLQAGTDGRDGPTDAAGAIVDGGTLARIEMAGQDIQGLLRCNDSYTALRYAGDLLVTGATGTNVADLGVLIRFGQ